MTFYEGQRVRLVASAEAPEGYYGENDEPFPEEFGYLTLMWKASEIGEALPEGDYVIVVDEDCRHNDHDDGLREVCETWMFEVLAEDHPRYKGPRGE